MGWGVGWVRYALPLQAQGAMLVKLVELANHCNELNNFYSVFAVVGGLGFPSVTALKPAWKLVPRRILRLLAKAR